MAQMHVLGNAADSPAATISSILSSYLLTDPPSPPSALCTILLAIANFKPFLTIDHNSQALHKWNTRISSLLQSKLTESRYWGVCLAKVTVMNGGEGVNDSLTWSKLLLNILNVRIQIGQST